MRSAIPLRVLIVEDDRADVMWVTEALSASGYNISYDVVRDGERAITYLEEALQGARKLPHLMFLDLNLPRIDGFEVAEFTTKESDCSPIFVCALTTSDRAVDVERAYKSGAHHYIQKPTGKVEFNEVIKMALDFIEHPYSHLDKRTER